MEKAVGIRSCLIHTPKDTVPQSCVTLPHNIIIITGLHMIVPVSLRVLLIIR